MSSPRASSQQQSAADQREVRSSIRLTHAHDDSGASAQKPSFVLLQFLLLALYLILLSVLYLIQLGMGLFCLIFLASLTFFLKVLMEP